jgi:uncharacterized protein
MDNDAQLDALNDLLHGFSGTGAMSLSEFDGFVAGVLVCPEMVSPSEWLAVVFGGELPPVADIAELQRLIDSIMGHYNEVAQGLARPRPVYAPVLAIDPNSQETLWEPWVAGFEQAMRLRPDAWAKFIASDDEEVRAAVPFLLELHAVDQGTSELDEAGIDELDRIAPEMIPLVVLELNRWTKSQYLAPPHGLPQRRSKVGRNERCPCGSGKKFKTCCGAVTFH